MVPHKTAFGEPIWASEFKRVNIGNGRQSGDYMAVVLNPAST